MLPAGLVGGFIKEEIQLMQPRIGIQLPVPECLVPLVNPAHDATELIGGQGADRGLDFFDQFHV